MGRRARRRDQSTAGRLAAPRREYLDSEGNLLVLRGSMTAGTRRSYSRTLSGGLNREDAWQRALELLFEHLAMSWTIAGLELTGSKELLGRYRMASPEERRFVRDSLRAHLAETFPELEAP